MNYTADSSDKRKSIYSSSGLGIKRKKGTKLLSFFGIKRKNHWQEEVKRSAETINGSGNSVSSSKYTSQLSEHIAGMETDVGVRARGYMTMQRKVNRSWKRW